MSMPGVDGRDVLVTESTSGFDSPYLIPEPTNNVLYFRTGSFDSEPESPRTLHLSIDAIPNGTIVVIRGKFNVRLFKPYTDTEPESIQFGTRRLVLVDVESFSSHAYDTSSFDVSADKPLVSSNLTTDWLTGYGTVYLEGITDSIVPLFTTDDTPEMRKFNLMSVHTPLSQSVLASADGSFNILLAGVNLLDRHLHPRTSLSNSIPCHITQEDETGTATVTFAQTQSVIVLEDVVVSSSSADALTLINQRATDGIFEVRLKAFTNSVDGSTPAVRLVSNSTGTGNMRITSHVSISSADYVELDCDLTLDASTVASGQTGYLFQFKNVKLQGSLSVGTANGAEGLSSLVELLNVHVDARGAGYWEPKSSRISFRGSPVTSSNSPPANWTNEPDVCVIDGLRVRYTTAQGRVTFNDVILVSDVPSGWTNKSINFATANYALVVRSEVLGTVVKNVPVNFEGNSVVVVKHQDAYGMMFDSSDPINPMAHVRIAAGTTATIKTFRAYSGSVPLTNVGVVFMGANISDEPFDISEFDMSHMGFVAPESDDETEYLNSIVFGTSAMSVDGDISNLSTIARGLVGQKPKWISRKGHHLTSWKYDEVPVLYRKIDSVSGRKVLYEDTEGLTAVPMRQDLVFILGLSDASSEFTGANGGLVGMDLELHSNANVDGLVTDELIDSGQAGSLLDALELKLFGKDESPSVTPEVGIAGFMNSETGGSEIIRVFNAQPVGEVSIFFEPDEGFLQDSQRRYYYLGDSTFKARFYDASTTSSLFQSQYPSAWGLPAFTYALVELDQVDAKLVYDVNGTFTEYDGVGPVPLTSTNVPVHLEPDHAFLLGTSVWIEPFDQEARLGALQVDGSGFSERAAVTLKSSTSSLYNFTFVTSNTFNLRHSTTTTTWANNEQASIVFRILPYLDSNETLSDSPTQSALVMKQPDKVQFVMQANVSVVTTVPNLFLLRRVGDNSDAVIPDGATGSTNITEPNLFNSSTAIDAEYLYNSSNMANSEVRGETCTLGLTMFSKASETPNDFVSGTLGESGSQIFAIIPDTTVSKLFSTGSGVNTFANVPTVPWEIGAVENCSTATWNLTFSSGDASGSYPVLIVPNSNLGDASNQEASSVIKFTLTPRTTDSGADMANQTMGRIMCGRFRIVPLKQNANATPTISSVYHVFSRVPTLYAMTNASGTVLTSGVIRIYQFPTTAPVSDLEIQFVAKPHRIDDQEDVQLDVRTAALPPASSTLSFEITEKSGFGLSDASIVFDAATTLKLYGTTSDRTYKLGTRWADLISPNANRIFQITVDHIRRMLNDNTAGSATATGALLKASSQPTEIEQQRSSVLLNWYDINPSSLTELESALSGSTGGGNVPLTGDASFDVQIRSSSRSDDALATSGEAGFSRKIRLNETRVVDTGDYFRYANPTRSIVSNGELVRKLASLSERIWVGVLFRNQVLDSDGQRVGLEVHFEGTVAAAAGGYAPKFYTSYSGDTQVNQANPITYTPQISDPDRSLWLGAWLDVSDLVVSGTPSSIQCEIKMVLSSESTSAFSDGLNVVLGYLDLSDAGRVELVDMSGTQLSSLRIGNWTLYSDAAGDLRARHRTFVEGEGSGTDAGVRFTLDASSVDALKTATNASVLVSGTGFRLTGHVNTT